MSQLHWVKLDHKDWLSCGALRNLSRTIRSVWMDLYSLSFTGDQIGHLKLKNKPLTIQQIAKIISCKKGECESYLEKLFEVGLCEKLEDGTIIIPKAFALYSEETCSKFGKNAENTRGNCAEIRNESGEKQPKTTIQDKDKEQEEDIDKKERNPQPPLNTEQQTQVEPVKTEQEELEDSINILSKVSGVPINICKTHSERWLVSLGGNIQLLLRCLDQGNMGIYPIQYTNSIVKKYTGKSNITVLQPKTNKQRMTEEMGLCQNLAEFQVMYPDDEIPDNYQTRSFGRGY